MNDLRHSELFRLFTLLLYNLAGVVRLLRLGLFSANSDFTKTNLCYPRCFLSDETKYNRDNYSIERPIVKQAVTFVLRLPSDSK